MQGLVVRRVAGTIPQRKLRGARGVCGAAVFAGFSHPFALDPEAVIEPALQEDLIADPFSRRELLQQREQGGWQAKADRGRLVSAWRSVISIDKPRRCPSSVVPFGGLRREIGVRRTRWHIAITAARSFSLDH